MPTWASQDVEAWIPGLQAAFAQEDALHQAEQQNRGNTAWDCPVRRVAFYSGGARASAARRRRTALRALWVGRRGRRIPRRASRRSSLIAAQAEDGAARGPGARGGRRPKAEDGATCMPQMRSEAQGDQATAGPSGWPFGSTALRA